MFLWPTVWKNNRYLCPTASPLNSSVVPFDAKIIKEAPFWTVVDDKTSMYMTKGDCPVSDNFRGAKKLELLSGFEIVAKEEKITCPEKVDLKWNGKSPYADAEGTYTLDTQDMSYRKPNSNWAFKPEQDDFFIFKAKEPMFWIKGNCPVSDAYKDNENSPVPGLEVTEHKEEEK